MVSHCRPAENAACREGPRLSHQFSELRVSWETGARSQVLGQSRPRRHAGPWAGGGEAALLATLCRCPLENEPPRPSGEGSKVSSLRGSQLLFPVPLLHLVSHSYALTYWLLCVYPAP